MSCTWLLSLASLWAAVAPAMTIQSDTPCPSAEAIHAALAALGGGEKTPAALVKVRAAMFGLAIELGWPDSPQPIVRHLTVDGDCAARARDAAVVVAVWLGLQPRIDLPDPVAGRTNQPSIAKPLAATPVPSAPRWLLGFGIGASTSGDLDVAPALVIEGTRRLSGRVALAVTAAATGPRQRAIGPGTSYFVRPTMTLAGRILLPAGAAHVGFDAGLAGGLTLAWGTNYPNDESQFAFDWGPTGGFRLLVGADRFRPWLATRLVYWVRSQRLRYDDLATGAMTAETISPIEGSLAVGFDVELW